MDRTGTSIVCSMEGRVDGSDTERLEHGSGWCFLSIFQLHKKHKPSTVRKVTLGTRHLWQWEAVLLRGSYRSTLQPRESSSWG